MAGGRGNIFTGPTGSPLSRQSEKGEHKGWVKPHQLPLLLHDKRLAKEVSGQRGSPRESSPVGALCPTRCWGASRSFLAKSQMTFAAPDPPSPCYLTQRTSADWEL
jgi:hypothetical protein